MDYELIRSKRRTLCLEITRDGRTLVRAPQRMSLKLIEAFVEQHEDWIRRKQEQQRHRTLLPEPGPEQTEALRQAAKEYIPPRVAVYSELMGLKPTSVKITGAKTRFGSCSGKNALCFSLYLMRYPETAIDSVIVHELAHIRHHNHGKDFYRLIETYMPDYRERQKVFKGK